MAAHDDLGPLLVEAAPWIARFAGRVVVVKLGGELLEPAVMGRVAPQLAVMHRVGIRPIVVHGGGAQIDQACRARGIEIDKVGGRRVTSPAVLEVLLDVVGGELNGRLVEALRRAGLPAEGYADGVSRGVRCVRRPPRAGSDGVLRDWGEVGDVVEADLSVLSRSLPPPAFASDPAVAAATGAPWTVPVIPSLGWDGERWYNVNADAVAARVAIDAGAGKLVLLTSVRGVQRSPDDAGPISRLGKDGVARLIAQGIIHGGMQAKVEEALRALDAGVPRAHILSGREPMSLLRELFTDDGCGTLLLPDTVPESVRAG